MLVKVSEFIVEGKSDRQVLQDMFDSVTPATRNVVFDLEGRDFKIDGTVYWKKEAERITTIIGYGSTISVAPGVDNDFVLLTGDKGKGLLVAWDGEDDNIIRWMDKVRIFGLKFNGGTTQLELVGTSQSKIQDCCFYNAQIGIKVIFGLQTNIEQCFFQFHTQENVLLLTGAGDPVTNEEKYFPNGKTFNSQSNRSVVRDCRFFNKIKNGSVPFSCVRTMGNDGIHIDNCVFEGAPAEYPIYHDRQNSTTVVCFRVSHPHIEYPGFESYIKALIYARGGISIEIEGIYVQAFGCVNLDCDASAGGTVHVIRPLYMQIGNGGVKAGSNYSWKIYDPTLIDIWFQESSWVDGEVPDNLFVESKGSLIGYKQSWNLVTQATGGRIGMQTLNLSKKLNRVFLGGHQNPSEYMLNISRILDYGDNQVVSQDTVDTEIVAKIPVLLMKQAGKYAYLSYLATKPKK